MFFLLSFLALVFMWLRYTFSNTRNSSINYVKSQEELAEESQVFEVMQHNPPAKAKRTLTYNWGRYKQPISLPNVEASAMRLKQWHYHSVTNGKVPFLSCS